MKKMAQTPTHQILISSSTFFLLLLLLHVTRAASGKWDLLQPSIGIVAMHMQLLHTDRVLIYDRTDYGLSNISLPAGKCRYNLDDKLPVDCTAHSVEYDVAANSVRPLMVLTDVWCSSGAVMPDGTLVQAGGFSKGDRVVRLFTPCRDNTCDWNEVGAGLVQRRWYSTSHVLPGGGNGSQIIIGGRRQFNYEFYPKTTSSDKAYNLPFLVQTNDKGSENNLYPFVFLNLDGNLFIFANNRAILFDYKNDKVLRTYPEIPGGDPRSYPSTGSAVLLPLKLDNARPEVLICGGAPKGSYIQANNQKQFVSALNTCARISINDVDPRWAMETMPSGRVMGDMLLLPDGNVLIVNGAGAGTAGWENGRDPVFEPVVYRPDSQPGGLSRFEVQAPSSIPRMYHSSAVLLRDGRVLVGGSNPHVLYRFKKVLFPTELSLESFSPSYLDPSLAYLRPTIIAPASQSRVGYGQKVAIRFGIRSPGRVDSGSVKVTMVAPSFTTHSFAMNQRMLVLTRLDFKDVGESKYQIRVVMPGTSNVAPSGYYLVFVVHQNIPSEAIWVHIL